MLVEQKNLTHITLLAVSSHSMITKSINLPFILVYHCNLSKLLTCRTLHFSTASSGYLFLAGLRESLLFITFSYSHQYVSGLNHRNKNVISLLHLAPVINTQDSQEVFSLLRLALVISTCQLSPRLALVISICQVSSRLPPVVRTCQISSR